MGLVFLVPVVFGYDGTDDDHRRGDHVGVCGGATGFLCVVLGGGRCGGVPCDMLVDDEEPGMEVVMRCQKGKRCVKQPGDDSPVKKGSRVCTECHKIGKDK